MTADLLKNSSLYPLSQVASTKSIFRKFWWILVLIVGFSGSVYQVTMFLYHYLTNPVVVDLKVENKLVLDFPVVTVCNLNRMRQNFVKCMDQNSPFSECKDTRETGVGAGGRPAVVMSERRSSASCSKQFSGAKDGNAEDVTKFLSKYITLNYEDRKFTGDPLDQLITYCFFDNIPCEEEDFTYFQSLQYGNCFTFNKIKNNSTILVPANGKITQLELILYLVRYEYLNVTPSHGARVVIHDTNEQSHPEERGINVSPGFEISIKIKEVRHRRLKAPYTDKCIDYMDNPDIPGNNQRECVQICIQELNLVNCSCVDPTIAALNDKKHCNISDSVDACCLDHVINNIAVSGLTCNCPSACLINNYEKKLSFAKWPNNWYKCRFCKRMPLFKNDIAYVKILYSDFEQKTYYQSPMFQDSQLYSNIGSLMSLWLGLSLLVVFEVIEMVVYIIFYSLKEFIDKII